MSKKKKVDRDTAYHNTLLLLKKYRDVVWSLTVAIEQVKHDFHTEYGKDIDEFLGQYRTIRGIRLDGTSACIFSVIRHKNSSQRVNYAREFLFRLTKNLTVHLYHQNCAVLP